MGRRFLYAVSAFLAFAFEQVAAETPEESLGKLPVCAQACITSAFGTCRCTILDLTCACNCSVFRLFSESCTNTSCADSYLKPVLDAIDGTCQTFASSRIALPATPTATASTSLPPKSTSFTDAPTTTPASATATDLINPSLPSGQPVVSSTGLPTETVVQGDPTWSPSYSSELFPSEADVPSGPGFYPTPTTITTAAPPVYTYCPYNHNATATGWNSTSNCTAVYNGPQYTGNEAAGRAREESWALPLLVFAAGVGFLS